MAQQSGESPWSPTASTWLAGDYMPPAAPSNVSATAIANGIKVTWDNPTKNKDGTPLYDHKDKHCQVYYSDSSGIDPKNSSTFTSYFDVYGSEARFDSENTETTYYFIVVALDREGNQSQASSEVSANPGEITITPDVDDYTDNFKQAPIIGDGQIGLIFKEPSTTWTRWSRYKLWYDVDDGGGFTGSWTEIYEGPFNAYRHTNLNTSYNYKYKLAFVDQDDNVTSGTIKDSGGSGYQPNGSDNSNLLSNTIMASIMVATDEVRGDEVYAESQIVLGGLDGSGYIKSSNFSSGSDGFKILADGSAEFNDVTVRGTIDGSSSDLTNTLSISGDIEGSYDGSSGWKITGSGDATFLSGLTVGDTGSSDYMEYSSGTLTVEGSITADSISVDGGNVQIGPSALPGGGAGLYVASGGGIEVADGEGTTIFDSSSRFRGMRLVTYGTYETSGASTETAQTLSAPSGGKRYIAILKDINFQSAVNMAADKVNSVIHRAKIDVDPNTYEVNVEAFVRWFKADGSEPTSGVNVRYYIFEVWKSW